MAAISCALSLSGLRSNFSGETLGTSICSSSSSASGNLPLRVICKESRIGKRPVEVPKSVNVVLQGPNLSVKGPLGELTRYYPREVSLTRDESGRIVVTRALETRRARQMHGLFRTLTDNMVVGVSQGFEKKLQMVGVGYRATVEPTEIILNVGFSHPVKIKIPDGISVKVEENTRITVSGRDKCAVGQFAAIIRSWRPPEPYKGKGIKYADEVIRRKEGKAGKKK
ncbi:50S ribosomal protein L6, chloroplastic [Selaginella moellendorffii]|nr:50S ribosomal protein L6, chloroplastic [Selaginella moellendorffii]|eukprot:XP_002977678.2 50S ribosomal protein L6, chloroplastic [Selaginella moellendorffii]